MNRRDIIILAVLVNAGLLAVLFMMAVNTEEESIGEPTEITHVADTRPTEILLDSMQATPIVIATNDEGDNALRAFESEENSSSNNSQMLIDLADDEPVQDLDQDEELLIKEEESPKKEEKPVEPKESIKAAPEKKVTETSSGKQGDVTVKRGDSLDKIARANGTTVKALKDANQLKSDKLNIGQVLKVPANAKKSPTVAPATPVVKAAKPKEKENQIASADTQFYTVKSGDNPWKIAKQFNMKVDDLLKLNNLNEEKARNLKVGDKVRVK